MAYTKKELEIFQAGRREGQKVAKARVKELETQINDLLIACKELQDALAETMRMLDKCDTDFTRLSKSNDSIVRAEVIIAKAERLKEEG